MPQIKDTGTLDTSLTGSELIPFQDAAGGAGSTKHTTAQAIADLGGGGGGAPADWISVYKFNAAQPIGSNTIAVFDTANDPPSVGTAITFNGTDTLTINEDGRYDVSAKLLVELVDPNVGDGMIDLAEVKFNDDNTGPFYTYDLIEMKLAPHSGVLPLLFSVPGTPMTAGQTLQLLVSSLNAGMFEIRECAITVSRIA